MLPSELTATEGSAGKLGHPVQPHVCVLLFQSSWPAHYLPLQTLRNASNICTQAGAMSILGPPKWQRRSANSSITGRSRVAGAGPPSVCNAICNRPSAIWPWVTNPSRPSQRLLPRSWRGRRSSVLVRCNHGFPLVCLRLTSGFHAVVCRARAIQGSPGWWASAWTRRWSPGPEGQGGHRERERSGQ